MNRALFLDRDGVINQDLGYVHSREKCIFYPEIFDVIRLANETGYKVIIVTNQAGIGRGYYTENVYLEFMRWMMNELNSKGCWVDKYYHCPHHPFRAKGIYLQDCNCRKPKPGMFLKAIQDFNINTVQSIMIGDNGWDMEAANAVNVKHLIQISSEVDRLNTCATHIINSHKKLYKIIENIIIK